METKDIKVILEYSEVQNCFHFNYFKQQPETNGYTTITVVSEEEASKFTRRIYKRYPKRLPDTSIIRLEWMLYCCNIKTKN
jgi:hypothetical protein